MRERLGEKQSLVARYRAGEPVKALCAEAGVSKSSFYEWIALYRETVTDTGQVMTPRAFEFLRRRVKKLEELATVLKTADCPLSASLQQKLAALEKLHRQFSVHVLCEALEVPRGTPHDSAVAESFFASFKKEEFYRTNYRSEAELRKCIADCIAFYNDSRPMVHCIIKRPVDRNQNTGQEIHKF